MTIRIRRRRSHTPHQPSLFEPPPVEPRWSGLTPNRREAVTRLFALMLRAHWDLREGSPREATDDE